MKSLFIVILGANNHYYNFVSRKTDVVTEIHSTTVSDQAFFKEMCMDIESLKNLENKDTHQAKRLEGNLYMKKQMQEYKFSGLGLTHLENDTDIFIIPAGKKVTLVLLGTDNRSCSDYVPTVNSNILKIHSTINTVDEFIEQMAVDVEMLKKLQDPTEEQKDRQSKNEDMLKKMKAGKYSLMYRDNIFDNTDIIVIPSSFTLKRLAEQKRAQSLSPMPAYYNFTMWNLNFNTRFEYTGGTAFVKYGTEECLKDTAGWGLSRYNISADEVVSLLGFKELRPFCKQSSPIFIAPRTSAIDFSFGSRVIARELYDKKEDGSLSFLGVEYPEKSL